MNFRIGIYQLKQSGGLVWFTLGLGEHNITVTGKTALKMQRELSSKLKGKIGKLTASEAAMLVAARGIALERVHLALTIKDTARRKISGVFPLIVEPRWISKEEKIHLVYHPRHQAKWFSQREQRPLDEQSTQYFQNAFVDLTDHQLNELPTNKKDLVTTVAFSAEPKSIFSALPDTEQGLWDDLRTDQPRGQKKKKKGRGPVLRPLVVLPKIGVNQTSRAIEGTLPTGAPRARFRDTLLLHLAGEKRKPVILVGPHGSGKSTIFNRFVRDLVDADDYPSHRNLDRIHNVWSVSGKRMIAGMSLVGEWEERVNELVGEMAGRKLILFIEDVFAFGRIGRTRDSDRCLANAFRGPLERQEILLVGEATAEQLAQLEDDAPSFAALFTKVFVTPTSKSLTYQIMFHEARGLELSNDVAFDAMAYRTIYELADSLYPSRAFPGKSVDLLHELAKPDVTKVPDGADRRIGSEQVLDLLSERTGLPRLLLQPEDRLDASTLSAQLERYVMGQPRAVRAAVDVVLRIRAGLTDPMRPYAVYLFTGPTGTGKTELAKCIAEYLYGTTARLLRLDMSELAGPDAPSRLVGDRYVGEGLLTQPVIDQPFRVVLLDEIEKAHPSVLNLLLQLFDEGRLTDARGNTADFRHTVVIMTSNLGARARAAVGFSRDVHAESMRVDEAVRAFFPPELFNRIDRIVPFAPLDEATALMITEKELSKLVTRRGLTERSIFVSAGEPVLRRAVREGFDGERGARPLQRYLEDRIGALLTDHITRSKPATMQIVRVYPALNGFSLDTDVLVEAEPTAVEYALTPWLETSTDESYGALTTALEVLHGIGRGGWIEHVDRRISDALRAGASNEIYHLDQLKLRLHDLQRRLEGVRDRRQVNDPEMVEPSHFPRDPTQHRAFDMRAMTPNAPKMSKEEIFELVAEAEFLRRCFEQIETPGRHGVFVELLRIGQARHRGRFGLDESGLLERLARAYLDGPGELGGFATRLLDGRLLSKQTEDVNDVPLHRAPAHLVLEISGLGIFDHFEGEIGSHVWQSLASGTELVRVDVWASGNETAEDVVARFIDAQNEYESAVLRGEPRRPPNPHRLRPAVRKLRYEPDAPDGRPQRFEVENYRRTEVSVVHAKSLADALRPGWLLEKSRRAR